MFEQINSKLIVFSIDAFFFITRMILLLTTPNKIKSCVVFKHKNFLYLNQNTCIKIKKFTK